MLSQPVRLSWVSKLRRPLSASVSNGKTRQDLDRVTNRFFLSRVQLAWANHPSHRHKSRAKRTVHTLCGHFPPLTCEPAQFSTARACALALFPPLDRQRAPYRGGPPAPGALLGRHAKPLRVDRQKRLAGRALDVAVGRVLAPSRACVARRIELHQPADHPVARPPPPPLVGCSRPPGPCAWHSIPAGPDRGEGARVVSSHFLFFLCLVPRVSVVMFSLFVSGPQLGTVGNVPRGAGGGPSRVQRPPPLRQALFGWGGEGWRPRPILAVPAGGVCGRRGGVWASSALRKCARARLGHGQTTGRSHHNSPRSAPPPTHPHHQTSVDRAPTNFGLSSCGPTRPPPPSTDPFSHLL